MFERYTDHARRAVKLAQDEARNLRHTHLGTEDLLVALMRLEEDIPARALARLGVPFDTVRRNVEKMEIPTATRASREVPFTDSAKKSLEFALREALQLGHNFIGTEHLLLGIVRHDSNAVNAVYGVYPATVRQTVITLVMERAGMQAHVSAQLEEPTVRSSTDISAEIELLDERRHELKSELDAAIKRETGCDPSYHH